MGKLYFITALVIALYIVYRFGGRWLARHNEKKLERFKEEYNQKKEKEEEE
ncbi:MAG: hypothetical protein SPJ13_06070 [Bacteroidales bacterium]|nr:hypothetical protein [Bacteroidales bacterium]